MPWIWRAPDLETQLPGGHYLVEATRRDLGAVLSARGEYDRAEPLLLASHAALMADRGADHYLTTEARAHLHTPYTAWGKSDQAFAYAAEVH